MTGTNQRAWLLYERGRHDEAIAALRASLANDPHDAEALGLLALCHGAKKEFDEAERLARASIEQDPEYPFAHYVLADVLSDRNRMKEALASIEHAIGLDPTNSSYRAFRGALLLALDRREDALASAEEGLSLDPTNARCLNVRAQALLRLGREHEARATLQSALADDPEDPHAHAAQGWTALHGRQYDQALFHFSEALRRDPTLDYARAGLVEAMKAKNWLYRPLLAWFLFMGRLTEGQRWLVILGIWFLPRILRSIGKHYPAILPVATVVGLLCLVLVLVSWLGIPIANLLLCANKFGRAALLPIERQVAYFVGAGVGLSLLCLGLSAIDPRFLPFAGACFITALAGSGTGDCEPGYPRKIGLAIVAVLAILAFTGATMTIFPETAPRGLTMLGIAVLGAMFSSWILNVLISMKPKR